MKRFLRNDEFYLKFISCVVFVKKLWFFHVTELKICVRFPSLYLLAINVLFQTYIDSFKCNMFICSCRDHMDFDIATLPQISPLFLLIQVPSNMEREPFNFKESVFSPNIHKLFYLLFIFEWFKIRWKRYMGVFQ